MILGYLAVIYVPFPTIRKPCSGSLCRLLADRKETSPKIIFEDRKGSHALLCWRSLMAFKCSTDTEEAEESSLVVKECWRGVGRESWGNKWLLGFLIRLDILFFWEGLAVGGCLHSFWRVFPKGFVFVHLANLLKVNQDWWTYLRTFFYIIKD